MTLEAKSTQLARTLNLPVRRWSSAVLNDWKFIVAITFVAVAITSLPYVYAYLSTPPNEQFIGIVQNAPDSGEYLAWMRESMRGILISNTLTPEPNAPVFFNLAFWMLGRFALYTGLGLVQTLQLFRLASGILLLIISYYFCSIFMPDRLQRRTAFLIIVCASGFSFYIAVLGKFIPTINFPAQFVAEGTTLYSLMSFPLLVFGASLFTLVFAWALRSYQEQNIRHAVGAGLVTLILGLSHGYDLILIYGVLAAFTLVVILRDGLAWHWLRSAAVIVGLSVWPSLYFVYLTRADPVWRQALAQFGNAGVFSPNPLNLLLLLGLPLFLALITFDGFLPLKERSAQELFLKTWFIVNFFLIYLPVEYQIHFINGWQIPIALLATDGLFRHVLPSIARLNFLARHKPNPRLEVALATLFVLAVLPSSLYFVGWRLLDMSRHESPYFLQKDQVAALDWLRANTVPEDVVLSSYEIGCYLPGLAGDRAFLAHWAMTLGFYDKRERVARFFDSATADSTRLGIIRQFDVRYVYWSDAERALGTWNAENASFLERAWSSPGVTIYRVKAQPAASGSSWQAN